MSDPTQTEPYFYTCLVEDGIVTALTGMANAFWIEQNPGHIAYEPTDEGNRPFVGLGYADGVFEQPIEETP